MRFIEFTCPICGCLSKKQTGHYNRAKKMGLSIFCSRICMGIGHRVTRTTAEKKKIKADYDRIYRTVNVEEKRKKHHEYFKRTYDPVKAAIERKKKMPKHVEYCRQPEYKKWKKEYDKKYRALKDYGEFGECFILLYELEGMIDRYEASIEQNTFNKSQQRKRLWKNLLQST